MIIEVKYIISGLVVGFLTGLTGIGGGSLMTPVLILFLGFSPIKAVGTDLFFNAITKVVSVAVYHKKNHVEWKIVGLLAIGSIPAVFISLFFLHWLNLHLQNTDLVLKKAIGCIIIISTVLFLMTAENKAFLKRFSSQHPELQSTTKLHNALVILSGMIIGAIVAFTSIGSGILGTIALILFYPAWISTRIIATEMAHAIPITLVAGLGYVSLGHTDFKLLICLVIGSIPAAYCGSRLATIMPHRWLRYMMVICLIYAAIQLLLH